MTTAPLPIGTNIGDHTLMKQHVMLDLETMGTRPDAAIIAIGAVTFDETGECEHAFYTAVSLASSMQRGGTVDAATIQWWMARSDEARKVFTEECLAIHHALHEFSTWLEAVSGGINAVNELEIWGNGADFDNVILTSAYRNAGLPLPWGTYKIAATAPSSRRTDTSNWREQAITTTRWMTQQAKHSTWVVSGPL